MAVQTKILVLAVLATLGTGIPGSVAEAQTPPWKTKSSRPTQIRKVASSVSSQSTRQQQAAKSTKPSEAIQRRFSNTATPPKQVASQNTVRTNSGVVGSPSSGLPKNSGGVPASLLRRKQIMNGTGQSAIQKRLHSKQTSGDADPTPPSKIRLPGGNRAGKNTPLARNGYSNEVLLQKSRNLLNAQGMSTEKVSQVKGQLRGSLIQNGPYANTLPHAGRSGRQASLDRLNQLVGESPQGHLGPSRKDQNAMDQAQSRLPGLPGLDSRMPNLFDGSNSRIPARFGSSSGGQDRGSQSSDPFGSQLEQYMAAKGNRASWAMDGDDDNVTSQQVGATRDTAIGAVAGGAGASTAVGNGAGVIGGIAWGIGTANTSSPEQKKHEVDGYKGLVSQGRTGHLNENAREMDPEAKAEPSPLEQRWNSLKEKYFGDKDKDESGDDGSRNTDSGTDNDSGSDNDDHDSGGDDNGTASGDSDKEDEGFFQKVIGNLFGGDDEDDDGQPLPDGAGIEGADATEAEKAAALERIQTEVKAGLINPGQEGSATKPDPDELDRPAPGSNPRQGWAINPGPGQEIQQRVMDPSVIERLRNSLVDPPKPGLGGTPTGGDSVGPAPGSQGPIGGSGGGNSQ